MVSFQGKYRILSVLSEGECQSFRALQISSGRPVLLHHLAAGRTPSPQPDLASLIFRFLRSASAEEGRHFLDMGEDEGRMFVVTADVPECQDLRKWLQSVTEAQAGKEGDAQPAEETPGPGSIEFTRGFTTEALRQVSGSPASAPAPPSPGPRAEQPVVPTPEKSPDALKPPAETPAASSEVTDSGATDFTAFWEKSSREKSPEALKPPPDIPAASSEVTDGGPSDFAGFWEKSSPASLAAHPASIPTPPASLKSAGGPSEVPEVTEEFFSRRRSLSVHDAPTEALPTLKAQAAERERAPFAVAGPAEAKGNAAQSADLVLTPPEVMKPPVAPSEAEVSKPSPQPALTPDAKGPETKTPREFRGLLVESDKAPPQAAASPPTPSADDKQKEEVKVAEKIPLRPIPMGFEVVFQSNKPRSRPTLSGFSDQSGIMAAPAPSAPPTGPEESAPTPATAGLPDVAAPVVSPPAEKMGGRFAMGLPSAPGEQRQAVGARKEPTALPSPPTAGPTLKESEQEARLVPTLPVLPARPAPPAPPGDSALPWRAAPPVSAPMPTPPNRAQPGEYTRMIENVKAVAGPLPPVGPPGVSPAPPAPPGDSALPWRAAPPVSAPMPTPPNRAQPGEYTRMIENVRAVAGPLPPVGPPGISPAPLRPAANLAVPGPAPSQASYLHVPVPQPPPYHEAPPPFQPSLYIANDTPSHSAGKKRKIWVPILILSSLFLMTVALLLFFAFKH
jgi:hypothetical protein